MWAPLLPGTLFPQTLLPGKFLLCFWNVTLLSPALNSLQWFPKVNYSLLSAPTTHFAFTSLMGLNPIIVIYKYLSLYLLAVREILIWLILCLEHNLELMFFQQIYRLQWYLGPTFRDLNLFGLGSSLGISDLKWRQGVRTPTFRGS